MKSQGAADTRIRPCYQQQIRAIAWRRAQPVLYGEFEKQKQALTASLSEHLEAGHDGDALFSELHMKETNET